MGAHHTKTAMLVRDVQVGVKRKRSATFIRQDRGLPIDNITIRMKRVRDTFPNRFLDMENIIFRITSGGILGEKRAPPAKTRNPIGPLACDHVINIKVMTTFFQHEPTGIISATAPVAHEKRAVIWGDMLVGFQRCNLAQRAVRQ